MRRTVLLLALAGLLAPAFGAPAGERASINRRTGLFEPPVSDLRKASERGDRAELAREATRLGVARVSRLLADPDRRIVLAALDAAPLVEGGVLLLEPIELLLASADDAVRARAVAATATLFAQSGLARLGEYEIAPETVSATCRALATLAGNEGEAVGTRLSAIQGLIDAGRACTVKLDGLLASGEPEVRRAAVFAVPLAGQANASLAAAVKDSDVRVAGAAAARLCEALGPKQAALPPLHDIVLADGALVEDVALMLPCLAASPDPADAKALTRLQEGGRAVVREAIKRLHEAR